MALLCGVCQSTPLFEKSNMHCETQRDFVVFSWEDKLQRWRTEMTKVFPDIKPGDTLIGVANPGKEARFYTRDKFIAMPFSDKAAGRSARDTIWGTMAANTGQRMARPMPLLKVSSSNHCAVRWPVSDSAASTKALTLTHNCVAAK